MNASTSWNELVPQHNRLISPSAGKRSPSGRSPTHIVIHITGSNSLATVKSLFTRQRSVSAHYLIAVDGSLFQFVPDAGRAHHAGIDKASRALYRSGAERWKHYLRYFSWYRGYPRDAVFVDAELRPVWDRTEATFVARRDGRPWDEYDYFTARWPHLNVPPNFATDPDPNNYSIGIELMGMGSRNADPAVYTAPMYSTLHRLVLNLSSKYGIPRDATHVLGHEDVHPIGRFGWDPNMGFDWSVVRAKAPAHRALAVG